MAIVPPTNIAGRHISIRGIVQGVGFRPHVYNLAKNVGLRGFIRNSSSGVTIAVEGPEAALDQFTQELRHLDASMVERALQDWSLSSLDYLFIENVGNLVCPSSFDLGEDLRLVLTSTTEGEDKPLKYPTIFNTADVAVITKLDLSDAVDCDLEALRANIQRVRPGMDILTVSAKKGIGMQELREFLVARTAQAQVSQAI